MSGTLDSTIRQLDECGCCTGTSHETPMATANRPGLAVVAYRAGDWARFRETLLARLTTSEVPALAGLRTRDTDDFTIALLDAFSVMADVLTFYQQRNANEQYLGTATERLSILELARLIGYELSPGIAASTYLAFTVEDVSGGSQLKALSALTDSAAQITAPPSWPVIPIGTKVQSLPGPGEQAQTFETVDEIQARPEWNRLRPRLRVPRYPSNGDSIVYLDGSPVLEPGDRLLFVGQEKLDDPESDRWNLRRVRTMQPDARNNRTKVTLDAPLANPPEQSSLYTFRQRASIFGYNAPDWMGLPKESKLAYLGLAETASVPAEYATQWPQFSIFSPKFPEEVIDDILSPDLDDFVQQTGGSTGPVLAMISSVGSNIVAQPHVSTERPLLRLTDDTIDLDQSYPKVAAGSWLVLALPNAVELFNAVEVSESSRADYLLSGKTTRVQLTGDMDALADTFGDQVRRTAVFAQSEELPLAESPILDPVRLDEIVLDTILEGLLPGRRAIVTGRAVDDATGQTISELVEVKAIEAVDDAHTKILFTTSLVNVYERESVTISVNVARATHGETVTELLGAGDASQPFQRFDLKQSPLTYLTGGVSTLSVRVDDVLWSEVTSLYARKPDERVYAIEHHDDGHTTVVFGDGAQGARLPTGRNNVRATYRKGAGVVGHVAAGQITQLMTRPLGAKEAVNPLPPEGGQDSETLDQARRNAPLKILTLDRVVSLQDYEDFARAFGGIEKALATWTWTGERNHVFLTVAGAGGTVLSENGETIAQLIGTLREVGDPRVPIAVKPYTPVSFRLSAGLRIDPAYDADLVIASAEKVLRDSFSFSARDFGQSVALSEVTAVLHRVDGILGIDIDELYRADDPAGLNPLLFALVPRPGGVDVIPAELLTLSDEPVGLESRA